MQTKFTIFANMYLQTIPGHNIELPLPKSRKSLIAAGIGLTPGCYAVYQADKETCLYIGRSECLLKRIMEHRIDQQDGNGVQWRLGGSSEWYVRKPFAPEDSFLKVWFSFNFEALEKQLISALRPVHNRHFIERLPKFEIIEAAGQR